MDAPSESTLDIGLFILLNVPIDSSYHPMNLLPASAPTSTLNSTSNIADLLSKPLSCHRFDSLIGDIHSAHCTAVDPTPAASTTSVVRPTVATTPVVSNSVPIVHPNLDLAPTLPIVLDAGASYSRTPFASDFALEVTQAPYGLFRSASALVASSLKVSSPVDPYTLITGEDTFDLSSPDTPIDCFDFDSDSGPSFKVFFDIREFGTSTLTFVFSTNLSLIKVFVSPTQIDWANWIPLPRLILPESYFHIFGLDYLQAFALFHLIPIWIYCLLHFAVNLE